MTNLPEHATESTYLEVATWVAAVGVAYLPVVAMLMNH